MFYNIVERLYLHRFCFEFEMKFQVKKLVQKCISRDSMHYRKITDKPLPGQGGEKEEEVKEIKVIDTEKLAVGKYNLWSEGEGDTDFLGQRREKEKKDRGIQIYYQ